MSALFAPCRWESCRGGSARDCLVSMSSLRVVSGRLKMPKASLFLLHVKGRARCDGDHAGQTTSAWICCGTPLEWASSGVLWRGPGATRRVRALSPSRPAASIESILHSTFCFSTSAYLLLHHLTPTILYKRYIHVYINLCIRLFRCLLGV